MEQKAYYETIYASGAPIHHHSYLRRPLVDLLIAEGFPPPPNLHPTILDVGCGNGSLSHWLASLGYVVTGLDISLQGIETARRSFPDVTFLNGDVRDLPGEISKQKFDIVLATEVIEHLYSPAEFVHAIKRCIAVKGRLVLTTPYHGYFKNLLIALLGKIDGHFNPLWEGGHIKFFPSRHFATYSIAMA